MTEISIPHRFTPREYQVPVFAAMDGDYSRACLVWHRRAGKDLSLWNLTIKKALERRGAYFYTLPTYNQAKKVIWTGMSNEGIRFLDHIPKQIIRNLNNTEMRITLKNGSLIQLVGTDNIDSIVGTNPVGVVFSEYALQNPKAWELIRPILALNNGWAVFNFTPRGRNHGFRLFTMAESNPDWFVQRLGVEDTGLLDAEAIERERAEGMPEELIQSEYFCSWDAPLPGAYYKEQLDKAHMDKRITTVPWTQALPVYTGWDIGIGDSTAIFFVQSVDNKLHVIDYEQHSGEALPFYVNMIKEKPYTYAEHFAPHDIGHREFSTGKSRVEMARDLGLFLQVGRKTPIDDGINCVRASFNKMHFDVEKCGHGIDCLAAYRKEFDEKHQTWKVRPVHDWSSHAADAMRTFCMGWDEYAHNTNTRPTRVIRALG